MGFLYLVGHAVGSAVVGAMVGDGVALELFFALDPKTMMDIAISWQRRVSFIMVRFFVYYFESRLCYCVGYESDAFDVVDVDCEVPHAKKFYLIYFFSRLF